MEVECLEEFNVVLIGILFWLLVARHAYIHTNVQMYNNFTIIQRAIRRYIVQNILGDTR
jgi:hypothetical protein